jgi:hypothetical protein
MVDVIPGNVRQRQTPFNGWDGFGKWTDFSEIFLV